MYFSRLGMSDEYNDCVSRVGASPQNSAWCHQYSGRSATPVPSHLARSRTVSTRTQSQPSACGDKRWGLSIGGACLLR